MELSPSLAHARVIQSTHPQLAYTNQPFETWRRDVKKKIRELLRIPRHSPVTPTTTSHWKRDTEHGTIEKISFPVEPGADAIAYWCLPKSPRKPTMTFICLQGHSSGAHNSIAVDREDDTKPITVGGDGDFGIGCMQRGIAALCLEQRSFGYRREQDQVKRSQHPCHDAVGRAMLLGRTLLGERVYDVDRSLDWLEARGDIDMSRVGIVGHSGGGTTSMYAMALLDRLRMGIVAGCFAKYADCIATISHCPCNVVPDIMLWLDAADILGAGAPKPLVIHNGETDELFPIASARAHFPHLQKIYAAAGATEKVKLVVGNHGHRFGAEEAWNALFSIT